MSTRSMTVVASGSGTFTYLYRHHDGYPAIAGAAIVRALERKPADPEAMVCALLSNRYNAKGDEVKLDWTEQGERVYQLVNYGPEKQGDLEHVYILRLKPEGWTVSHHARGRMTESNDDYREWTTQHYKAADFAVFVGREVAELERRIEEHAKRAGRRS